MSEFHIEAPQATTSEGLAQGPYMVARARFEPTTLWTKGAESKNEPPRLTSMGMWQTVPPQQLLSEHHYNTIQMKYLVKRCKVTEVLIFPKRELK